MVVYALLDTTIEGTAADGLHAGGDGNGLQTNAVIKGIVTDDLHTVGDGCSFTANY